MSSGQKLSPDVSVRAVGYVRVSTQEQVKNGWNLEEDKVLIQERCDERGWTWLRDFDDGGLQGDDPNRSGLLEMLASLDQFDVIVVRSQDRLSRDLGIWTMVSKALRAAGVRVETFVGPLDLETPYGEFFADMMAVVGKLEKRQTGIRVKQAMQARARAGKLAGGIRPYGYRWVSEVDAQGKKVSHLEQVPAEAEVVKRLFNETCKGASQRSLARMLMEEGVTATRGGGWVQGTISAVLRNPLYKGEIRHKGEVYKGEHQGIVSADVWDTAQKKTQSRLRRAGGRWPKGSHLLTKGLLRCGQCGWAMVPRTTPGPRRTTYEAYECHGKRTRGLGFCDQPNIAREIIDGPLLADLTQHYIDLDETRRQIEARSNADLTIAQETVLQADREAAAAEAKLARVRSHYQSERITPEDWSEQRPSLIAGVEAAREALGRAKSHLEDVERSGGPADGEKALLQHLATIRSAVSDGIGQARDLNTLRLILGDMFASFELIQWPGFGTGGPDGYATAPVQPKIEVRNQIYALLPRLRWNAVDVEGGLAVRKAVLPVETRETSDPDLENMGVGQLPEKRSEKAW